LGRAGEEAAPCVPSLERLLDDKGSFYISLAPDFAISRPVRYEAAHAIGRIRKDSSKAVPRLQRMMQSDDERLVRLAAAFALYRITPNSKPALAVLAGAVADRDEGTENPEVAAELLGELGPLAEASL